MNIHIIVSLPRYSHYDNYKDQIFIYELCYNYNCLNMKVLNFEDFMKKYNF